MFPEGPGPGLIYLINFKSDRLAEAVARCLFLSLATVRYGGPRENGNWVSLDTFVAHVLLVMED